MGNLNALKIPQRHRAVYALAAAILILTALYLLARSFDPAGSPAPGPTPATSPNPSVPTAAPRSTTRLSDLPRVPWEGGSSYWSKFEKAAASGWTDPSFFPMGVWYESAERSAEMKSLGLNFMIPVHDGYSLTEGAKTGMHYIAGAGFSQADLGSNAAVVGREGRDECDMGLGGCAAPVSVIDEPAARYQFDKLKSTVDNYRAASDGRFVYNNYSKGILGTYWGGTLMDDFMSLVDVASADFYYYTFPRADTMGSVTKSPTWPTGANPVSSAAYGWSMDRMRTYQNAAKLQPNWNFVEVGHPAVEADAPTMKPEWMDGAVWSSIINEARGIVFFNHSFGGSCQSQHVLSDCQPAMEAAVKRTTAKVHSLAPVLNTQSYEYDFANGTDTMLKASTSDAYVFASIGLNQVPGEKEFNLPRGVEGTKVHVIGENRKLSVTDDSFTDTFAAEHTHHVYRISLR